MLPLGSISPADLPNKYANFAPSVCPFMLELSFKGSKVCWWECLKFHFLIKSPHDRKKYFNDAVNEGLASKRRKLAEELSGNLWGFSSHFFSSNTSCTPSPPLAFEKDDRTFNFQHGLNMMLSSSLFVVKEEEELKWGEKNWIIVAGI